MILRSIFLSLSGLIFFQSGLVADQAKPRKTRDSTDRVERADSRPKLAIKFAETAQLKIGLRKSTFYIGEMVTIDIALLNTSSQPLFFHNLSEANINAINSAGRKMVVQRYGVPERALVPALFVRLSPGEMIVRSFQLLLDCDKRAFAESAPNDDRTVFNQGLFLNWGDACLPSPQRETYTLSVDLRNDYVLVPSRTGKLKSAVGTINSNTSEMTILR